MPINQLIRSLSIPGCTDSLISEFIQQKGDTLRDYTLALWSDFILEKNSNQDHAATADSPDGLEATASASELPASDTKGEQSFSPIAESNNSCQLSQPKNNSDMSINRGLSPVNPQGKENSAFESLVKNRNITIQNGKVNQPYSFGFRIEDLNLPDVGMFWFEGLEPLGLRFNEEHSIIEGVPQVAGDHKLMLKIKRNDWCEGKPIFERAVTFIINPDPKMLWKNIPTPTDIEYFKPDSDKQFVKVEAKPGFLGVGKRPRKDMVAASQRGRSHAQEGRPRDDDFALRFVPKSEWYIMAVADGAGSASASRKGAQIACQSVVDTCEKQLNTLLHAFEKHIKEYHTERSADKRKLVGDNLYHIVGNAVFTAFRNIDAEAKASGKPIKEFSTTLIVSICKKFKFGWFVGAFWVGDGGIAIYNYDTDFLKVLGESDGGEYAGQTRFLTMPEITQPAELYRRLRFEIVEDFTALMLMTDGVTDPKFETDSNLLKPDKWKELWENITGTVTLTDDNDQAADELLSWLDFWSPGNHDDRTIAILY